MCNFSLISTNFVTRKTKVLIENDLLVNLDKYTCKAFDRAGDIKEFYGLGENDSLKIRYRYQKYRYLDILTRNFVTNEFHQILAYTKGSQIERELNPFENYVNRFLNNCNQSQLEYLYFNHYIDSKLYNDLLAYIGVIHSYYNDYMTIIHDVKSNLRRYINFRKLYMGLYNFEHRNKQNMENEPKKIISTENEYLDSSYNYGGMDEVYGNFDLEDLVKIEGSEQLNIDGIRLEKRLHI